jgi:hypothetical protein
MIIYNHIYSISQLYANNRIFYYFFPTIFFVTVSQATDNVASYKRYV